MALFLVGPGKFFYSGSLYRAGTEVVLPDDKRPPPHLVPVDDVAKALYTKFHGDKQVPQSKPVATVVEPQKQSMSEHRDAAEKSAQFGAPKAKPEPQSKFNMADLLTGKK